MSASYISTPQNSALVDFLQKSEKLLLINAGFKFDDLTNQRCIALAKEAVNEGYSVLFIAWEWYPGELSTRDTGLIRDRLFQIGRSEFSQTLDIINQVRIPEKIFLLTVPSRDMALKITEAREKDFKVIYDIFDDWESFHQVGQATWYEEIIEHHTILNANKVTVVSPRLKTLFEGLRNDITVVPNGYTPRNLSPVKNRSFKKIGYFGHLVDGWFDWELVFELAKQSPEWTIEIIGSGQTEEIENRAKKYPNINLLGFQPYNKLPALTQTWSIGIIPFKRSRLSECVDPLKIYEYLELGLVSVSTGMPHLAAYPNSFHAEDIDQLVSIIQDHTNGSLKKATPEELNTFLSQARWSSRLRNILQ